jgi:hypothetical protein
MTGWQQRARPAGVRPGGGAPVMAGYVRWVIVAQQGPGVPADQGPPSHDVLAALVASLRQELADALGALEETRAELGRERERIAELEARLNQAPRNSPKPAVC